MIVLSAGRRIDEADARESRFPLKNVDVVARAIRARLEDLNADVLVCSAACGADLVALKEAQGLGIRRRIVLPFPPARFRRTSVADRPGNSTWNWVAIFDELIRAASESGDLILQSSDDETSFVDETAAYTATNQRIIAEAQALARGRNEQKEVYRGSIRALIIWEGDSRGGDDLTAGFSSAARESGIPVEQVDTLR
jgi:hypothetical protein